MEDEKGIVEFTVVDCSRCNKRIGALGFAPSIHDQNLIAVLCPDCFEAFEANFKPLGAVTN